MAATNPIRVVCQTLVVFAKLFCHIGPMTKDWARLAEAVAERRKQLGLSQDAIRQAGGPSDIVVGNIENNKEPHPRDDTINKLDAPLRWEPGSAQTVLAGGEPTPVERTPDLRTVSIDELLAEIRERVVSGRREPVDDAEDWPPTHLRRDTWISEHMPRSQQG